jgi:hypothetical protein
VRQALAVGATVDFTFSGRRLDLVVLPQGETGQIEVQIDGETPQIIALPAQPAQPVKISLVSLFAEKTHQIKMMTLNDTPVNIDGFIVE